MATKYTYDEIMAMKKPPKKKPEKPRAEVIPLPSGPALEVAKQDRTRASEIDRALERKREGERERLRRAEALVNSEAYRAAGMAFNEGYFREVEEARKEPKFDPTKPHGFW
jgi:hypothetical protein